MERPLPFAGELPQCQGRKNPQSIAAFKKLLNRLYPLYADDKNIPFSVEVVHGNEVNAFASFGGHIFVYEALLKQAQSPDELAGVLAHEMEHVARRHIMQGALVHLFNFATLQVIFGGSGSVDPSLFSTLLNMKFGRIQEHEADEGGLKRLRKAQIDVSGFVHFFERAQDQAKVPTLLSDHPSDESRAALARQYQGFQTEPIMTHEEWVQLKKICEGP